MIQSLQSALCAGAAFEDLAAQSSTLAAGQSVTVNGVTGSFTAFLLAGLHDRLSRSIVVVAIDRESAERIVDDIAVLLGPDSVRLFTGSDVHDIRTIRSMVVDPPAVLVTHPPGLLAPLPKPSSVGSRFCTIEVNSNQPLEKILGRLEEFGFHRKEFVEACGDLAIRGGILDVFPFVGDNPVRFEFFGDTVESVREFDPVSQRSVKELKVAIIVPDLLAGQRGGEGHDASSLLDYIAADALIVLEEPEMIRAAVQKERAHGDGRPVVAADLDELLPLFPLILLQAISPPGTQAVDLETLPQPAINGSVRFLLASLRELQEKGFRTMITCDSPSELLRLKELIGIIEQEHQEGIPEEREMSVLPRTDFLLDALHGGFVAPHASLALFTEHQIFNRMKRRGRKRTPRFKGFSAKEVQLLRKGDYVVHQDYGIGRFDGLRKIRVKNVEQEVVRVLYEANDTLYVNLNYINKLQKYSSREGHIPKLTRLGSPEWERLKSRTKKRVKEIARDLITLYARRKHMVGFAFPADTPWQKELEAAFMYEDTFDQAKSTREVKQDMETPCPMDRLVCGDVGFGKTEVAVRAAFKAVLSGKQVAVLVPTTILAMQHLNTFVDRTSRYGTIVQILSRFRSKREQADIITHLKDGRIDIIIGTHRLLSKDIGFKNLGLLVIDEEHRFGVTAKEKLRLLRTEVDTLALTATPIPRTLHFSLMGARDLSIIATPPRNRLPVITEITPWNDELIRDAVTREIQRGGQVYFVHDRILNIEEVTERVRQIVPGVRVEYAHGQMRAHELEEVMVSFLQRGLDILVSTKIIESGLDIPNVNTMIINRADRFGMAELYQLRGRVGRSNVQAYAYLLTPPVSTLPKHTLQRLQAVEEFTELGSGFNLAMRDLEIRGAGNLLGSEQTGFIESMGFETYTRILEEAVQELKEQEFQDLFRTELPDGRRMPDTAVEAEFDALIPEFYVANDIERLAIYRRLYSLNTGNQLREVAEELKDRFGRFPDEVENLLAIVNIRLAAAKIGFKKVFISPSLLEIDFPPEEETHFYAAETFQHMMTRISLMKNRGAALRQSGKLLKLVMHGNPGKGAAARLQEVVEFLDLLSSG